MSEDADPELRNDPDRTIVELASAPTLGPLFARAITRRPTASTEVEPLALSITDQRIEADRLAAYQRLCGYRVGDDVPAPFLHVLTFPLAVARMTRPDFPFRLLGMVHVHNHHRQLRAVRSDEPLRFTVHADGPRPHSAGQQIDLVSQAFVGDELVWAEASTYLHREPTGEHKPRAPRAVPEPWPSPPIRLRVPADIGRRYAAISGDRNPIHLSRLSAKAFGFKTSIAHGMWLLARSLATFEGRLPTTHEVDIAFKTPVFLPATVELTSDRRTENAKNDWDFLVASLRSGRPHLSGRITSDSGAAH